ncbi:hypothetical protein DFH07DRAFT_829336 [Mycena maculata]|uniref:RING-type domain-containing protein n=1 Tax=Mycena maculata TaxID=230809 RepID=A0AAD7ITD3_9AGAR|nr:hypothetical protein DFH07DRAFT_829336 [Mycena maculata]
MFKKYKAFMKNEGQFEPPGARALAEFRNLYDAQLEMARVAKAVRAAEDRASELEEQMRAAERRVSQAENQLASQTETVMSAISFPDVTLPSPDTPPEPSEPEPGSSTCPICSRDCQICPNPWQRTRTDIVMSKVADIDRPARMPWGITLQPCGHVFCGACLAQSIYHNLNMAFDPATYGTKLPSHVPDDPGLGRAEFPMPCPMCQMKKGVKPIDISDRTARMVLGESNMEEWNHARFLMSLNLVSCPYSNCNEAFDVDDIVPPRDVHYERYQVQCPRCKRSMCKACKSVWHENLTCLMYQASPIQEHFPARIQVWDVPRDRRRAVVYSPADTGTPWAWEEQKLRAHA